MENTQTYTFAKMHGLGNDFVIFDARKHNLAMTQQRASFVADRRRGVGCDQLIVLRSADTADVFMEIWNADGTQAGACGNATRCVGQIILAETGKPIVTIETVAGMLTAEARDTLISVNMGTAHLNWDSIPLSQEMDTKQLAYTKGPLSAPGCVNMGNPHAVFFVDDAEAIDLEQWGPVIEHDPLFPERVNVSVVSIHNGKLRQRVWERGAGITEACGSGACAAVVAACRRGLVGRKATTALDGGDLTIEWLDDGTAQMTGPSSYSFTGEIDL